ncbi:MAG: sigma-70 family RNA polymerase sigma factor [Myxococcota bacterium]
MRPQAPDPEIFAAALRGEDAAWTVLHNQWAPVVLGWCSYLGAGRIDADEAARDVFFRLWQKADRIHGPAVFRSFLYSITRRVISEHRRKAWFRRWAGEPLPNHADAGMGPDQQTASRQIALKVQQVLQDLKDRDREIIVLCDIQGYSSNEAAELLGIAPNTAKSRLARARDRFASIARRRNLSTPEAYHA